MYSDLNTAIHQFAKRQETYFRRMEKNGMTIHWINADEGVENITHTIINSINKVSLWNER